MSTDYEWKIETGVLVGQDDDIEEVDHADFLSELAKRWFDCEEPHRFCLVKSYYTPEPPDWGNLDDMTYAYIDFDNRAFPEVFEDGSKVPKVYQREVAKFLEEDLR